MSHVFSVFRIDESFIDVYKMNVIAGRNFSSDFVETNSVIVNRKASELLGFSSPNEAIGNKLLFRKRPLEIVGVIENYHHKSLKNVIEPMILRYGLNNMLYYSIQFEGNNINVGEVINKIKSVWLSVYPDNPFNYFFLDDHFNEQYRADQQFAKLFGIFSSLAIFLSCLGLFGLSSFLANVRLKEIGIRKVLGASTNKIIFLLTKDYVKPLLISVVLGLPLSIYLMQKWLNNFTYKTSIGFETYFISISIVLFVALITVGGQTLKAALSKPIDTLKNEE
jgi:putative ABC transport system permease protein